MSVKEFTRVRPYGKQISNKKGLNIDLTIGCLLYTSPSPRDY